MKNNLKLKDILNITPENSKFYEYFLKNQEKQYEKISEKHYGTNPCVYAIYNIKSHKIYIGHTVNYKRRIALHKSYLRKNKHHSQYFQRSFNKHGEENFICFQIEECEDLCKNELFWINYFDSYYNGYNCSLNTETAFKDEAFLLEKSKRQSIPVVCFNLDGTVYKRYSSGTEAAKDLNTHGTVITAIIKGKVRCIKNKTFIYEKDYDSKKCYKIRDKDFSARQTEKYRENLSLKNSAKKTPEQIKNNSRYLNSCIYSKTLNKIFPSFLEISKYLLEYYGVTSHQTTIKKYTDNNKIYKGFEFEYF